MSRPAFLRIGGTGTPGALLTSGGVGPFDGGRICINLVLRHANMIAVRLFGLKIR